MFSNDKHNCSKLICDNYPDTKVEYSIDYGIRKDDGKIARNILKELIENNIEFKPAKKKRKR